jgi:hypothetical protein
MKTLILGLIMMLTGGGVAAFAAPQASETAALAVKGKKKFIRSKVTVEFLSVLEDSRCPTGVDCVWAGNAKISIRVRRDGAAAKTIELNTASGDQSAVYEGYTIALASLTPHPRANVTTDPKSYRASITVSRQ